MEAKTKSQTAVEIEPMLTEYNLTLDGVIELPLNIETKKFFDGLLERILEYVESHGALAGLEMSYAEYDDVRNDGEASDESKDS
ncbi:hypothetical protein FBQ82_21905 [Anaerolineae bacterium CFX7]|nr:hypothetical protein [Anaerolineae bacterium CFX7]